MSARLAAPALIALLTLASCAGEGPAGGARAESCGECHSAEHEEWSGSRHASGAATEATSPVFQALLPRVEAVWGSVARARCVSCHTPGFGGDEAIGCVSCHAAVGNRGAQDGKLVIDLDAPLAASRESPPTPAHDTEVRGLLTASELCGTCHDVRGPGLFDEGTFTELQSSPVPGRTCVGCHLRRGDEGRADHRFIGVDPPWGAPEVARSRAAEDTRALLAEALSLRLTGASGGVEITLTNVGGGHAVPTGVSFLRDFWVDLRIVDASGATFDEPRIVELGARMTLAGSEVALPTDADTIESRSLAPEASRRVEVAWPAEAALPVSIEATLRARAVRASTLTALGLSGRADEVPELVVAVARWP